jgi:hypothetical protein
MYKLTLVQRIVAVAIVFGVSAVAAFFAINRVDLPTYADQVASVSDAGLTKTEKEGYILYAPADYRYDTASTDANQRYYSKAANKLGGYNNLMMQIDTDSKQRFEEPTQKNCDEFSDGFTTGIASSLSMKKEDFKVSNVKPIAARESIGCTYKLELPISGKTFIIEGKVMILRKASNVHVFNVAYDSETAAEEVTLLQNAVAKSYIK